MKINITLDSGVRLALTPGMERQIQELLFGMKSHKEVKQKGSKSKHWKLPYRKWTEMEMQILRQEYIENGKNPISSAQARDLGHRMNRTPASIKGRIYAYVIPQFNEHAR